MIRKFLSCWHPVPSPKLLIYIYTLYPWLEARVYISFVLLSKAALYTQDRLSTNQHKVWALQRLEPRLHTDGDVSDAQPGQQSGKLSDGKRLAIAKIAI